MLKRNDKLKPFSQALRRNMTAEESKLWYRFLKTLPLTVKRQTVIGDYIVDFYCDAKKTVIELDGSQHYEEKAAEYDRKRNAYLNGLGLTVLRYSNYEVNTNFIGVCDDILYKFGLADDSIR